MADFKTLNNIAQLNEIDTLSHSRVQIIFKHSTRCSVSSMAKRGLDADLRQTNRTDFDIYYLDLLNYRDVSNQIATRYGVQHQSPQILVIRNGQSVFDAAQEDVSLSDAWQSVGA
ncbi:MAG TPA: bacillithiol system redox-active protein YtxJ [Chitinophagales bacterium]|nr:bacillithiol system redox-active protein YtxJ [Chitinophagales bacterium]